MVLFSSSINLHHKQMFHRLGPFSYPALSHKNAKLARAGKSRQITNGIFCVGLGRGPRVLTS